MNNKMNYIISNFYTELFNRLTELIADKIQQRFNDVDHHISELYNLNHMGKNTSIKDMVNDSIDIKLKIKLVDFIDDIKNQNTHEIDNLRYFCEGLIECKFKDLKNYIDDRLK